MIDTLGWEIGLPLVLALIGWVAGRHTQYRHLRQLAKSEAKLAEIRISNTSEQDLLPHFSQGKLISAEVALSEDAFARLVARLRALIGGEIIVYQQLQQRARREAEVRLKREAMALGSKRVVNVRYKAVSLTDDHPTAAYIIYGTALF